MSLSNLSNTSIYPLSLDGLTSIVADTLTVNGNNITGDYLNSKTDTADVNTSITLTNTGKFIIKDTTNNMLIFT